MNDTRDNKQHSDEGRPVGFSLPQSVLKVVDDLAAKQDRTRSNMLRLLIKESLQRAGLWPGND